MTNNIFEHITTDEEGNEDDKSNFVGYFFLSGEFKLWNGFLNKLAPRLEDCSHVDDAIKEIVQYFAMEQVKVFVSAVGFKGFTFHIFKISQ